MVRYLNLANHHPARITNTDKEFAKRLDFKDIKFRVKIRDIQKIQKKNSIGINAFGYENKEKYPIYISKHCCEEKRVDLFVIGEGKRHYVRIKDFNTFMYDHTLHRGRKHFCRYCLQVFSTEEISKILKYHIKECYKINGEQRNIMPKNGEMLNSKIMTEK